VKTLQITPIVTPLERNYTNGTNFFLQTSMGVRSRPVTRGASAPMKNFSPALEKCVGHNL